MQQHMQNLTIGGIRFCRLLLAWSVTLCCSGCVQNTEQPNTEVVVQSGLATTTALPVFSPDSRFLITTGVDFESQEVSILWDAVTGEKLRSYPNHGRRFQSQFAPWFCPDGRSVVIDGAIVNLQSGKTRTTLVTEGETLACRTINHDETRIAIATQTNRVAIFDLYTGKLIDQWNLTDWLGEETPSRLKPRNGRDESTYDLRFDPEGNLLAAIATATGKPAVWNLTQKVLRSELEASNYQIDSAHFSPDGRYVATRWWDDTGNSDEETTVYDTRTGQESYKCREKSGDAKTPLFTADNKHCVVGSGQKTAQLIDLTNGSVVHDFPASTTEIRDLKLIRNDAVLETSAFDQTTHWDWKTGQQLAYFPGNSIDPDSPQFRRSGGHQLSVIPFPDGQRFATNNEIVETKTGQSLLKLTTRELVRHPDVSFAARWLQPAVIAPNGARFIAHTGTESWLCDAQTGEQLTELSCTRKQGFEIQWNRDGSRAITRTDGVWRLWNIQEGRVLQTFGYPPSRSSQQRGPQLIFSTNGKFVCTHSLVASLWHTETGAPVVDNPRALNIPLSERPEQWHDNQFGCFDFRKTAVTTAYHGTSVLSADQKMCASWEKSRHVDEIAVWDLNTGSIKHRLDCSGMQNLRFAVFSQTGRYLSVSSVGTSQTLIWDLNTGQRVHSFPFSGHDGIGNSCRSGSVNFLPDDTKLLLKTHHRTLKLIDIISGETIHSLPDTPPVRDEQWNSIKQEMLFSPDNRFVVVDYGTNSSNVWDLKTGTLVLRIDLSTGNIPVTQRMQFSDDSRHLMDAMNELSIWDLSTKKASIPDMTPWEYRRKRQLQWKDSQFTSPKVALDNLVACPQQLLDKASDLPGVNAYNTRMTKDGSRLIIVNNDRHFWVRDSTTLRLVANCFRFRFSEEWLTVLEDGTYHGQLKHVRLREPHTINITSANKVEQLRKQIGL